MNVVVLILVSRLRLLLLLLIKIGLIAKYNYVRRYHPTNQWLRIGETHKRLRDLLLS